MREQQVLVRPFVLKHLLHCRIHKKVNEHAVAEIAGYIEEAMEPAYIKMLWNETWAEIAIAEDYAGAEGGERQERVLLRGVVTGIDIKAENGVKILRAVIKSGTYLMDLQPHIRTYQRGDLTYDDVLRSFMDTYEKSRFVMEVGAGEAIEDLIVQYRETDWTFVKRLASRFQSQVVPDVVSGGVKLFFGILPPQDRLALTTRHFTAKKCAEEYRVKKDHGAALKERDVVYCKKKTTGCASGSEKALAFLKRGYETKTPFDKIRRGLTAATKIKRRTFNE